MGIVGHVRMLANKALKLAVRPVTAMPVCFALAPGLDSWKAKPPSEEADPTGNFRKLHRLVITTANDELNDREATKLHSTSEYGIDVYHVGPPERCSAGRLS